MAQNDSEIRVVDAVLTTNARGYRNTGFVGNALFPIVDAPARGFKRIEFGREAFRKYNTRRAPGSAFKRIDVGHEGLPVKLEQHALIASTPGEHQSEGLIQPGLDIQARKVMTVQDVIALSLECAQADTARTAATYAATNKLALAGAARWDTDTSNPLKDIEVAKDVIRARTGRMVNTGLFGASVVAKLRTNPLILERFKHTTSATVTDEMLAAYFGLEQVFVGGGVYDDDAGTYDIWGKDAILAYVPRGEAQDSAVPAYGYTYRLRGHPMVSPVRWNEDFDTWENKVKDEWSPELVGPDAGFLFQTCIS